MALDGANFIAELSITDPPGSDPLSQGDDQIRTIKRATFQSFPLVAAAVNLTDAQLNLAAIKNEANVFTATQTIQSANLILNETAGSSRDIAWQLAGLDAWTLRLESLANLSGFSLLRFDALGAFIDKPWTISKTTGIVDFAQSPTINGDPIWTAGELKMLVVGSTPPSVNWFTADGLNGTVDLRERFIAPIGPNFTGGAQSAFLSANTDAGATDATALTEAQMPAHDHRIWSGNQSGITDTTFGHAATETVAGANRGNTGPAYALNNANGTKIIENAGSGNSHTHSIGELNVDLTSGGPAVNMPYAYFAIFVQYVP